MTGKKEKWFSFSKISLKISSTPNRLHKKLKGKKISKNPLNEIVFSNPSMAM